MEIRMVEQFEQHKSGEFVSNFGRVMSRRGKILKQSLTTCGYLQVGVGSPKKTKTVHRLVAEVFIGEIPNGYHVNHKDGNKQNNRLDNLEIVTASENQKHRYAVLNAKRLIGEANAMSKLSEDQIYEIYDLMCAHWTNDQIAEKYNVHSRYVSLLRHGKRWGHIFKTHAIAKMINIESSRHSIPLEIRFEVLNLLTEGKMQSKDIAEKFNLHGTTISHIKRKKVWKTTWELWEEANAATTTESDALHESVEA